MDNKLSLIDAIKSDNSVEKFYKLDKVGILQSIIPDIEGMKDVGKCKYHKVDCFTHTMYALEEFEKLIKESSYPSHIKKDICDYLEIEIEEGLKVVDLLRLGVFLHDIGKSKAKTTDKNGRVHFKDHDKISGDIAIGVGQNINLSKCSIESLYNYTRYHMSLLVIYKKNDASYEVLKEMFDLLKDDIIGVMLIGFADIVSTQRLLEPKEDDEILKSYINYILTVYIHKYKKDVSF